MVYVYAYVVYEDIYFVYYLDEWHTCVIFRVILIKHDFSTLYVQHIHIHIHVSAPFRISQFTRYKITQATDERRGDGCFVHAKRESSKSKTRNSFYVLHHPETMK